MIKYFVEYEFRSNKSERLYWFPMFIHVSSPREAENIYNRYYKALSERYDIRFSLKPTLVVEGLNTDRINQYVQNMARLKFCILNVNSWTLKSVETKDELSFDEHIELAIENIKPYEYFPVTLASGERKRFPVRIITEGTRDNYNEFLLIDVVCPNQSHG